MLLFDGDEAGQRAMERALEVLLPEGLRVRAAVLPAGEDPDSFLRAARAPSALRKLVDEAVPALDRVIGARRGTRPQHPGREGPDAVAAVAPLLALIPSAVEAGDFAQALALALDVEPHHVEAAVRAAKRGEDARDAVPIPPRRSGPEERNLRQLARSLVEHPRSRGACPQGELAPAGAGRTRARGDARSRGGRERGAAIPRSRPTLRERDCSRAAAVRIAEAIAARARGRRSLAARARRTRRSARARCADRCDETRCEKLRPARERPIDGERKRAR